MTSLTSVNFNNKNKYVCPTASIDNDYSAYKQYQYEWKNKYKPSKKYIPINFMNNGSANNITWTYLSKKYDADYKTMLNYKINDYKPLEKINGRCYNLDNYPNDIFDFNRFMYDKSMINHVDYIYNINNNLSWFPNHESLVNDKVLKNNNVGLNFKFFW